MYKLFVNANSVLFRRSNGTMLINTIIYVKEKQQISVQYTQCK